MKVHIQEEEIPSLTIDKTAGRECNIPAGLYNRYFSVMKSFEELQSALLEFYVDGEMISPAPPVRENTTADKIRSEILTELITETQANPAPQVKPPKKKMSFFHQNPT